MSLYDYHCGNCGLDTEQNVPMAEVEATISCPACGAPADRVYSAPTIRFIGPGFHNTDYRQGKKREDKEQTTPQETKEKADANQSSATR